MLTIRCLVTAARTSVVLFRQALNIGDLAAAETHRMDIEVVRYVHLDPPCEMVV